MSNRHQNLVLAVILISLVVVARLTHDNPYIMLPCALAAIVYSFWVGWKANFND